MPLPQLPSQRNQPARMYLAVALLVGVRTACAAPKNLAPNPSFETWRNGAPAEWTFREAADIACDPRLRGQRNRDDKTRHSGNASILMSALRSTVVLTSVESMPIKPGEVYLVSVWTKVRGGLHYGFIKPNIEWFDAADRPVGKIPLQQALQRYADHDRGHDWERQMAVVQAPANAVKARPAIVARTLLMDTVWLDDVEFRSVGRQSAARVCLQVFSPKPRRSLRKLLANGADTALLVGRVLDANGDVVADGTPVTWTAGSGRVAPAEGVTEDGFIETTFTAGRRGGTATITATTSTATGMATLKQLMVGRFHGQVRDAKTGTPLAARLRVVLADGSAFKGSGFWVDGQFDEALPVGKVTVKATRGPEYVPRVVAAEILSDRQMLALDLRLERQINLSARGWYSGDMHAHVIHGERYIPDATITRGAIGARAEGLDCYFATHAWDGPEREPSYRDDLCRRLSSQRFKADWNWEVKWFPGGHCWEINTHWADPRKAYPIGPRPHPRGYSAQFEAHHAIHQRGGVVGYTHPNVSHNPATELPFDLLAGPTFDAMDVMTSGVSGTNERSWYLVLNHGYVMPCTGTSDTCLDRAWAPRLGACRTYVYLGNEPLSIANFAAGIKAGRTFTTSGPLIDFAIDGKRPGAVLAPGPKPRTVKVWARSEADPRLGLTHVELVRNGEIARRLDVSADDNQAFTAAFDIQETDNAWYIARCIGGPKRVAITSPIYFRRPDAKPPRPVLANVTFEIKDAQSKPVTAQVEVVNYGQVLRAHTAPDGQLTCQVPPTAWFAISAPGCKPVTRSIFFDTDVFAASTHAGLTLEQKTEFLTSWEPYERVRRLLKDVRFSVRLESQ